MALKLCSKQCNQCLFSKNKVVSAERARDIIQSCKDDDEFFLCHKSPDGGKWVCRGFYDNIDTRDIAIMKAFPEMLPEIDPETNFNFNSKK